MDGSGLQHEVDIPSGQHEGATLKMTIIPHVVLNTNFVVLNYSLVILNNLPSVVPNNTASVVLNNTASVVLNLFQDLVFIFTLNLVPNILPDDHL